MGKNSGDDGVVTRCGVDFDLGSRVICGVKNGIVSCFVMREAYPVNDRFGKRWVGASSWG